MVVVNKMVTRIYKFKFTGTFIRPGLPGRLAAILAGWAVLVVDMQFGRFAAVFVAQAIEAPGLFRCKAVALLMATFQMAAGQWHPSVADRVVKP